jgi:hypothetical protein
MYNFFSIHQSIMTNRITLTKTLFIYFLVLAIPTLTSRAIRNEYINFGQHIYDFLNHDFVVWIEHLFAGFGVPALISAIFLLFTLFEKNVEKLESHNGIANFFWGYKYPMLTYVLGIVGYSYHMITHEVIKQTAQEGYWGAPKESIDFIQIASGFLGMVIFIFFVKSKGKA